MSRYRKTLQEFCIVTHEGREDPSLTLRMTRREFRITREGAQDDREDTQDDREDYFRAW